MTEPKEILLRYKDWKIERRYEALEIMYKKLNNLDDLNDYIYFIGFQLFRMHNTLAWYKENCCKWESILFLTDTTFSEERDDEYKIDNILFRKEFSLHKDWAYNIDFILFDKKIWIFNFKNVVGSWNLRYLEKIFAWEWLKNFIEFWLNHYLSFYDVLY